MLLNYKKKKPLQNWSGQEDKHFTHNQNLKLEVHKHILSAPTFLIIKLYRYTSGEHTHTEKKVLTEATKHETG